MKRAGVFVVSVLMLTSCLGKPEVSETTDSSGTGEIQQDAGNEYDSVSSATLDIRMLPVVSTEEKSNVLAVYFSTNDTIRAVAMTAADVIGADIFEIIPVEPYSEDDLNYHRPGNRAGQEQQSGARPAIVSLPDHPEQYDIILLGYPIWGGQAPNILYTFLESVELHHVTVLPFCTSNMVGPGNSVKKMQSLTDDTVIWLPAQRIMNGSTEEDLYDWARDMIPMINNTEGKTMRMTIGDTQVEVTWEENRSVDALRTLVQDKPLTIEMSMYGGFEQVGSIGQSLPRNDAQTTTSAGDIVLYSGNQIVVFYGSNTWAYTRLGRITGLNSEELAELLGNGDVTLTIDMK